MAKKIYINGTKRCIMFGKTMLLPGSNVVDEIDGNAYPQFRAYIENGDIEESDNAVKAVQKANTQSIVDEIAKTAPKDENVKKAAGNRKKQLDAIDAEAKAKKAEMEKKEQEDGE
ncbi:hypothetical protein [Fibrobacter sp. UWH4]|uniref:hypothetical protein n=1 Tax=Fibrobacter sp. UWH4 TaxID=1896210 RepID=UPI000912CA6A|nr:hypothetical protein [Fibrobacter sp. UWH4]SHL05069.1 hypothetical protein SAMN05720762_10462 [Fibrobacter sp. UWH4]